MEKVDVAIQSYKKPESLVYTLLSLKKYCGKHIDTIYINDDCSGNNTISHYKVKELKDRLFPIKIKVRENIKPSGYTHTLLTKEMWKRKKISEKLQLVGHVFIKRLKFYSTSDDIRYQWAINNTNKKYIFLIHDDIKFFGDVLEVYIKEMEKNPKNAIVGDLGGCSQCPFGPCGLKCSPKKIMNKTYPNKTWPITGKKTIIHTILGRYNRTCRINEWCCLIQVDSAKEIFERSGVYFGNYEAGGDIGTYWLEKAIKYGYEFADPIPDFDERKKYYLHWWQGHEGHEVWVDYGNGIAKYQDEFIKECLKKEFNYEYK